MSEHAFARIANASERIATALETLVRERERPKNQKRIRVKYRGLDPDTGDVLLYVTPFAYAKAMGLHEIGGQPGLYRDDDNGRIVNAHDFDLRHQIRVPAKAWFNEKDQGFIRTGEHPEFIVTVDLQPDPATWGWREWVRL